LKREPLLFFAHEILVPLSVRASLFPPFHPQKTTTMRRTVKGGKASSRKVAKSSGAQFYGPDR
jgi:hypothetical protein